MSYRVMFPVLHATCMGLNHTAWFWLQCPHPFDTMHQFAKCIHLYWGHEQLNWSNKVQRKVYFGIKSYNPMSEQATLFSNKAHLYKSIFLAEVALQSIIILECSSYILWIFSNFLLLCKHFRFGIFIGFLSVLSATSCCGRPIRNWLLLLFYYFYYYYLPYLLYRSFFCFFCLFFYTVGIASLVLVSVFMRILKEVRYLCGSLYVYCMHLNSSLKGQSDFVVG